MQYAPVTEEMRLGARMIWMLGLAGRPGPNASAAVVKSALAYGLSDASVIGFEGANRYVGNLWAVLVGRTKWLLAEGTGSIRQVASYVASKAVHSEPLLGVDGGLTSSAWLSGAIRVHEFASRMGGGFDVLAGHSLGGVALAVAVAPRRGIGGLRGVPLITYGRPSAGNGRVEASIASSGEAGIWNDKDPVVRLPPSGGFAQAARRRRLDLVLVRQMWSRASKKLQVFRGFQDARVWRPGPELVTEMSYSDLLIRTDIWDHPIGAYVDALG